MDLVEWQLIRDRGSGAYWVVQWHTLGWDARTLTARERLLFAVWGPYSDAQAELVRMAACDYAQLGVPEYRDLDAAERMPRHYQVVAHLGEDVLEREQAGAQQQEEEEEAL